MRIAGRCTVFAESDMIHKQQMGHQVEDILYGLCEALARNYLNNLGLGKEILPPVVFQGGVAANQGMVRAFEEALKTKVDRRPAPPHHGRHRRRPAGPRARRSHRTDASHFKGFGVTDLNYRTSSFECKGCSNLCEIVQIKAGRGAARPLGRSLRQVGCLIGE